MPGIISPLIHRKRSTNHSTEYRHKKYYLSQHGGSTQNLAQGNVRQRTEIQVWQIQCCDYHLQKYENMSFPISNILRSVSSSTVLELSILNEKTKTIVQKTTLGTLKNWSQDIETKTFFCCSSNEAAKNQQLLGPTHSLGCFKDKLYFSTFDNQTELNKFHLR